MKSNQMKKVLMATIGGVTATTTAIPSTMPVFAQDSVEVSNQETKSEKEKLTEAVEQAQAQVDQTKKDYDAQSEAFNEAELNKAQVEADLLTITGQVDAKNVETSNAIQSEIDSTLEDISNLNKQISDKQKELNQKNETLESKKSDLSEAEKTLEAKNKELEELQAQLEQYGSTEDLNTKLTDAKKAQEQAQTNYSNAQAEYEEANAALSTAQSALTDAKTQLNTAQNEYNEALSKYNEALTALSEAEQNYNSYTDENKENVEKEYNLAQLNVTAQTEGVNLKKALVASAQKAYDEAKETADAAQQTAYDAETARSNAENDYNTSCAKVTEAEKAFNEAKSAAQSKKDKIDELTTKITTAQNELNKANEAYQAAKEAYENAASPKEIAQAELEAFEKQYETEIKRLESGIKGYYESIGDTTAVEILNNPSGKLAGYTNIGASNDATSLANVQASLTWLKKCNELRKQNNLDELQVDMALMAIAQVNANWSAATIASQGAAHAQEYHVGENLAWGQTDPYTSWYDAEKAYYDFKIDYASKNPSATDSEIVQAAKDANVYPYSSGGSTGHYENIVRNYTTTGFAINPKPTKYSICYAQEFYYGPYSSTSKTMTVSAFETSLNSYVETMSKIATEYQAKKDAVTNASDSSSSSELKKAMDEASALCQTKMNLVNELTEQKDSAQTELTTLTNQAITANDTYVKAQKEQSSALAIYEKAITDNDQAQSALKSANANLSEKETTLNTQTKELKDSETTLATLKSKASELDAQLTNWDTYKEEASRNLAKCYENESRAKKVLDTKQAALDSANSNVTTANDEVTTAASALDLAIENQSTALDSLNQAKQAVSDIEDNIKAYNTASDKCDGLAKEIKELNQMISSLKTDINDIDKEIEALSKDVLALSQQVVDKQENQTLVQSYRNVLIQVLESGTQADLSSVKHENIKAKLAELASLVDQQFALYAKLQEANDAYNVANKNLKDAEAAYQLAKADYEKAMKALDAYIYQNSKHASSEGGNTTAAQTVAQHAKKEESKSNGVQTGFETNLISSAALFGLAGLALVETKRRKSSK